MKLKISNKRTKKCRGSSSIMLEGSYELPAFSIWISAFFVCVRVRVYIIRVFLVVLGYQAIGSLVLH